MILKENLMGRLEEVSKFVEYNIKNNLIIEPDFRLDEVTQRLIDVINTYKPGIIVKAGIGSGKMLKTLESKSDSYIVVVEPSIKAINKFIEDNKSTRIKFINGDFDGFPIDYYAADLIICIDYLDFLDSAKTVSEFRRTLKVDGILFVACVVLNEKDIEGIYDDFTRMIFPLHNDYYLASDLKTFLELKEFSLIKSMHLEFSNNIKILAEYFSDIFKNSKKEEALQYVEKYRGELGKIMNLDSEMEIKEPYYVGVFMRMKPSDPES